MKKPVEDLGGKLEALPGNVESQLSDAAGSVGQIVSTVQAAVQAALDALEARAEALGDEFEQPLAAGKTDIAQDMAELDPLLNAMAQTVVEGSEPWPATRERADGEVREFETKREPIPAAVESVRTAGQQTGIDWPG
jgi:hypothetical protein